MTRDKTGGTGPGTPVAVNFWRSGGEGGTRTPDPAIMSRVL
jgi:hypothetical protein